MSKTTTLRLGDSLEQFIEHEVAIGNYGSSSEVIRDGVRMLQEHKLKLAALRKELERGMGSPLLSDFDMDSFLDEQERQDAE
ncbi:MAG: type II toxin-antitoxin system ParD family antitoxin [Pseudomonadota bacterium]